MSKTPPQAPLPLYHPAALLATWFGAGLAPIAPGTWGSLAALPFAWIIAYFLGPWALVIASLIAYGVGIWASQTYANSLGRKDPGPVVIDEVAGQWLTLAVVPLDPIAYGIAFLLFRFFDIVKVWPANWMDRELEGGLGIMSDDMVAGLYGLIVFYLGHLLLFSVLL